MGLKLPWAYFLKMSYSWTNCKTTYLIPEDYCRQGYQFTIGGTSKYLIFKESVEVLHNDINTTHQNLERIGN